MDYGAIGFRSINTQRIGRAAYVIVYVCRYITDISIKWIIYYYYEYGFAVAPAQTIYHDQIVNIIGLCIGLALAH